MTRRWVARVIATSVDRSFDASSDPPGVDEDHQIQIRPERHESQRISAFRLPVPMGLRLNRD
jgi:hypothetical protein